MTTTAIAKRPTQSDTVKVAKLQARSARAQFSEEVIRSIVTNPALTGLGLLLVNHAIYKYHWYEPNARIPGGLFGMFGLSQETASSNMHDSIALFIMACSIAQALKQGVVIGNTIKQLGG